MTKTTRKYRRHVADLREVAAKLLDKTHVHDNRGPATWLARQEIAKWLDLGGRIPVSHIKHLQRVVEN